MTHTQPTAPPTIPSTLKLQSRNGHLHVRGTVLGKKFRRSTGLKIGDEVAATELLRKWESALLSGQKIDEDRMRGDSQKTFSDACDAYVHKRKLDGGVSRDQSAKVEALRSEFNEVELPRMDKEYFEAWMLKEYDRGLKAGSIARQISVIKSIMKVGSEQGWCSIPAVKIPMVDDARDEHMEIHEIDAFLLWVKETHPRCLLFFTLLIDTGVRVNEACRMTIRDVDVDRMLAKIRKNKKPRSKTKDGRSIPMSSRLRKTFLDMLDDHKKGFGNPRLDTPIFNEVTGERWMNGIPRNVCRRARDVLLEGCRACHIPPLRIHDLRHTFAYQCAVHGADVGDIQLLMGHRDIAMTMRYRGWIPSRATAIMGKFGTHEKA